MLQRVQKFVHTLHCQVAALQSNDSQDACCPIGWLEHGGSCYWFSPFRLSWSEAQWSCQLQNAHLVVVGSQNEQKFLEQHMYPVDTWIGLTDQHGPWTWVDGTDYKTGFQNWSPGQPDNWHYHGQEDCTHLRTDGQWNDNICMTPFCWVCETELNRTSS
ncbi:asialoglycoprotein receptor 1-like [Pipistrellus kuhlii]|uniref:asialoglycoprotein receptor 1-like n=1 Tax=Pipistrellus kuhlii TaxID=59472 RepID=UPI00174F2D10|nr:asialoglycoprotein receptor 1-like [Pipistrellus kuhlii]